MNNKTPWLQSQGVLFCKNIKENTTRSSDGGVGSTVYIRERDNAEDRGPQEFQYPTALLCGAAQVR